MKKLVLTGIFCSLFLVACSAERNALQATSPDDKQLEEQLKAYETTIFNQQQQIEQLQDEIRTLQLQTTSIENYKIVFRGDETASIVYPTLIPFDESQDLVEAIHSFVSDGYDIGLNSYRFEDEGRLLVLDYDENAQRVQGSAGTYIFLQSMQQSYFANFHELRGIKLLMNGDGTNEFIGQSGANSIFVRSPFVYEPNIEF